MTTTLEAATATLKPLVLKGKLAQNAASGKKGYPTGPDYIMEPKWDGWRIIAHVLENEVHFYSRSGKSYNGKLPLIEAELLSVRIGDDGEAKRLFPAGTWLDGEVVAITMVEGKVVNEWKVAQSVLTKVGADAAAAKLTYMVFDLIAHRDIDARPLALIDRKVLLDRLFENEDLNAVQLSPMREASEEVASAMIALGYEGAVVKQLNRPYGSDKREGGGWIKVKPNITIEGVVMGFKPGENGFKGMIGAVIFGQYENGKLVEKGKCSGMDMKTRQDMTANPAKYVGTVIEVGLVSELGGAGNPPQYRRHRLDRDPAMVGVDHG
jgi:bifunctional non-homologous end joining protein LigD